MSRARDGKEVGNLGGSKTFTKKKKTGDGTYGTNLDEETNTVEAEGMRLLCTTSFLLHYIGCDINAYHLIIFFY